MRPFYRAAGHGWRTSPFLELADGRVVSGFVVRESAGGVTIRDLEGVPREFASEEIDNRSRLPQSAMPQGIADALTPSQLADLIAYLQTL